MYVKVIKQPNGSSRLYIYESYVKNGKTANRSLEALGDLDELNAIYGDAIAHFKKICDERNAQKEKDSFTTITIDTSAVMSLDEDNLKNCGYGILKRLYRDLELNTFWLWKTRDSNIQYSADHIFRLLCFSRALYPASKKATFEGRANFFEKFDFTLDNVYDCLDIIADNVNELQEWLFKHSQNIVPRDMSVSYFDCTNYYFDIGHYHAPAPSMLCPASDIDWRFDSYVIVYMFQCYSPKSSHPCPLPQSSKDCSIHLCLLLFCLQDYRYHLSKFHIYVLVYCIGVFLSGLLHSV